MFYRVDKIAFAGDWHGNVNWGISTLRKIAELLADQDEKIVFQLGDFGFWPGKWGQQYIEGLDNILNELGMDLFFIDGNHENHATLKKAAKARGVHGQSVPCPITDRIAWLQRGTRFKINDKNYLALGGAASIDRNRRTENVSWFDAERITLEQRDSAIAGGPADVLLCHDSPANVPISYPNMGFVIPERDLALSQANRMFLQDVVDACEVNYVMHGHIHQSWERIVGKSVRVNCFNCDGFYGNWGVMDANSMEWIAGG